MKLFSVYDKTIKRWSAKCPVCPKVIQSIKPGQTFKAFAWHVTNCFEKYIKNKPRPRRNESGRNEELILFAVRKLVSVTRSDLAKETGLCRNTVINHTTRMVAAKILDGKNDWDRGWVFSIPMETGEKS